MKTTLLVIGIVVCGLLGLAKIWGLIFLEFTIKQAVYAACLLAAAASMAISLRKSLTDN